MKSTRRATKKIQWKLLTTMDPTTQTVAPCSISPFDFPHLPRYFCTTKVGEKNRYLGEWSVLYVTVNRWRIFIWESIKTRHFTIFMLTFTRLRTAIQWKWKYRDCFFCFSKSKMRVYLSVFRPLVQKLKWLKQLFVFVSTDANNEWSLNRTLLTGSTVKLKQILFLPFKTNKRNGHFRGFHHLVQKLNE